MDYYLWCKAKQGLPDKYVLLWIGDGVVVTFAPHSDYPAFHTPLYAEVENATRRLNELGVEWVLVNAPDEVAAACGVPE